MQVHPVEPTQAPTPKGGRLTIYIMTIGTRGDHQPAIVLGQALRARGHRVIIHGDSSHEPWFRAEGACDDYHPSPWTAEETLGTKAGAAALLKGDVNRVLNSLKPMYEEVLIKKQWWAWARDKVIEADPDLFVALGQVLKLHRPILKAVAAKLGRAIQSCGISLAVDMPTAKIPPQGVEWAPRCLWSQRLWRVQFKIARNVLLRKYLVEAPRKQLGFHMTTDEMLDGLRNLPTMQCTDASICPVPYDAPSTYVQGAPLILDKKSEEDGSCASAADFGAWLAQAAGDDGAPVYAGWGSMAIMTNTLALKLANACRRVSRRLVLLISWSKLITLGEGAHELSADGRTLTPCAVGEASGTTEPSGAPLVYILRAVAHSWLFPQCCCILHHGGAGTMSAALLAGKPQVVVPVSFDQFEHAAAIYKAGLGPKPFAKTVPQLTVPFLERSLRSALDVQVIAAARAAGEAALSQHTTATGRAVDFVVNQARKKDRKGSVFGR